MTSQIETPLYVPRATTHQFISRQHQQKRSALEGSQVEWWVFRNRYENPSFHHEIGSHSLVIAVPSTAWVQLNRLPTVSDVSPPTYTNGVRSLLRDTDQQTVDRVVLQCPIHRSPDGLHGLTFAKHIWWTICAVLVSFDFFVVLFLTLILLTEVLVACVSVHLSFCLSTGYAVQNYSLLTKVGARTA